MPLELKPDLIPLFLVLKKFSIVATDFKGSEREKSLIANRTKYTIYLCNAFSELNLNAYHFGWYSSGPSCDELLKNVYELMEDLAYGIKEPEKELIKHLNEQLAEITKLVTKPLDENISLDDSLRILASVHFLYRKSAYGTKEIKRVLKRFIPKSAKYFNKAQRRLKKFEQFEQFD